MFPIGYFGCKQRNFDVKLKMTDIKRGFDEINVKYSYLLLFLTLSKYDTLYFYRIAHGGGTM